MRPGCVQVAKRRPSADQPDGHQVQLGRHGVLERVDYGADDCNQPHTGVDADEFLDGLG